MEECGATAGVTVATVEGYGGMGIFIKHTKYCLCSLLKRNQINYKRKEKKSASRGLGGHPFSLPQFPRE